MRRRAHTTWRGAPAKVVREAAAGFGGATRVARTRHIPTARANTAYPQKLEHRRPVPGHSVAGRQRQPLALPGGVPNAGGGPVVEVQPGEVGVVQDAGDELACGSDMDVVAPL
jgi:hypothetical protein